MGADETREAWLKMQAEAAARDERRTAAMESAAKSFGLVCGALIHLSDTIEKAIQIEVDASKKS